MTATQLLAITAILVGGSILAAPDLGWALGALAWSVLGFLAGIGAGYLLWGRRKDTP
jgi:hypothetical protein